MVKGRLTQPGAGGHGNERRGHQDSPKQQRRFNELANLLRGMDFKDIGRLLGRIGFYTMPGYKAEREAKEKLIFAKAMEYLATADAEERIRQQAEQLLTEHAQRRADLKMQSPEFQSRVFDILAEIGLKQVNTEEDAFSHACRRAVDARLQQWLESARGRQTLEALKEQAVKDELAKLNSTQQHNWIRHKLEEIENAS